MSEHYQRNQSQLQTLDLGREHTNAMSTEKERESKPNQVHSKLLKACLIFNFSSITNHVYFLIIVCRVLDYIKSSM